MCIPTSASGANFIGADSFPARVAQSWKIIRLSEIILNLARVIVVGYQKNGSHSSRMQSSCCLELLSSDLHLKFQQKTLSGQTFSIGGWILLCPRANPVLETYQIGTI